MREPKETIVVTEEPDTEVELSAQDLRDLSEPRESNERECHLTQGPTAPQAKASITTAVPGALTHQTHASVATTRHASVSRLLFSLTFVIGAIGALYRLAVSSDGAPQPGAQNIVEQAAQPEWLESEPKIKGAAVLFANPFDAHEVFEFPAGTSEDHARDAVAQVLMDRAMKRQGQFDARVSKNN